MWPASGTTPTHAPGIRAAVPDRTQRVDGEERADAVGRGQREVQPEVAAPGVADDDRALPAQGVEHRDRVGDVSGDRERAARRRRLEAALLIAADRPAVPELTSPLVEVAE